MLSFGARAPKKLQDLFVDAHVPATSGRGHRWSWPETRSSGQPACGGPNSAEYPRPTRKFPCCGCGSREQQLADEVETSAAHGLDELHFRGEHFLDGCLQGPSSRQEAACVRHQGRQVAQQAEATDLLKLLGVRTRRRLSSCRTRITSR